MPVVNQFLSSSPNDEREMLVSLGFESVSELINTAIPEHLQTKRPLDLPPALSEIELTKLLNALAQKNADSNSFVSFLGAGIYDHFVPAIVDDIISRPEFYTAYTPYQAEASQGTLQAIFEFQSLITRLTAMEIANASMYDGASATAEAALLSIRVTGRKRILYAETLNPLYLEVLRTYLRPHDVELIPVRSENGRIVSQNLASLADDKAASFILQNPNFYGIIENPLGFGDLIHSAGGLFIVVVDPISLGLLLPPGDYGADVVTGEGQSLGLHQNFGGPLLGIFATKKEFIRFLPGRLSGETVDLEGKRGFVLTLQTREQHIKRERATSNICTNQALCALAATVYLSALGENGLKQVANLCLQKAHYLAGELTKISGVCLRYSAPFFKEFAVELPCSAESVVEAFAKKGILAGVPLSRFLPDQKNTLLVAVTEKRTKEEMDRFACLLRENVEA